MQGIGKKFGERKLKLNHILAVLAVFTSLAPCEGAILNFNTVQTGALVNCGAACASLQYVQGGDANSIDFLFSMIGPQPGAFFNQMNLDFSAGLTQPTVLNLSNPTVTFAFDPDKIQAGLTFDETVSGETNQQNRIVVGQSFSFTLKFDQNVTENTLFNKVDGQPFAMVQINNASPEGQSTHVIPGGEVPEGSSFGLVGGGLLLLLGAFRRRG